MNIKNDNIAFIQRQIQRAEQRFGKEYIDDARESLLQWDINGDGKTSAQEMFFEDTIYPRTYNGDNFDSIEVQNDISQKKIDLFSLYAGEDGALSGEEYATALNSAEYDYLLNEYLEYQDIELADKGITYNGHMRYDINNNNEVKTVEIYTQKLKLYNKVFQEDKESAEKAKDIALEQTIILEKYANSDGIISKEGYLQALSSDEYKETMNKYSEIRNNSTVSEKSKINQQLDEQMQSLADKLASSSATDGYKGIFQNLCKDLKNAQNEKQLTLISKKLQKIAKKAGIFSKEELAQIDNYKLNAENNLKRNELKELYDEKKGAANNSMRSQIKAEMLNLGNEFNFVEQGSLKYRTNDSLNSLFEDLSNAKTDLQKEQVFDEIETMLSELVKSGEFNKEDVAQAQKYLEYIDNQTVKEDLSDLFDELIGAQNDGQRTQIIQEINTLIKENIK